MSGFPLNGYCKAMLGPAFGTGPGDTGSFVVDGNNGGDFVVLGKLCGFHSRILLSGLEICNAILYNTGKGIRCADTIKNPTEMLDAGASSRGATVKLHRSAGHRGQQSGDDGKIGIQGHRFIVMALILLEAFYGKIYERRSYNDSPSIGSGVPRKTIAADVPSAI